MAEKVPQGVVIPEHWSRNTWEEKARENPLFAVMTTPNYTNSDSQNFTQEELDYFFAKGQRVYHKIVKPRAALSRTGSQDPLFVEYGCGMGRILKAIIEDGRRAAGMDISPTMIEHCRKLVPQVADSVWVLDENNRSGLADASADVVFSFAVMKHIHSLQVYDAAVDEMLRIMKPGAVLVLNINCEDFVSGTFDNPGRTVHFDDHSLHYRHGAAEPYKKRTYSTWSGIYMSYDRLVEHLARHGLEVLERFHHTLKKPQGIWIVARKKTA